MLALLDDDQILEANAIFAGAVIAGLVGEDHARTQRRRPHLGDALRALVHREIGADAMACAMVEIEAGLPQAAPREAVELRAARRRRETQRSPRRYGP